MVKAPLYTVKGIKTGELTLPRDIFEQKPNLNLIAQAVYVYQERGHVGLRKTQTRAEVNRTTKKLYKQKGTGGARHGSRRAPIFVGGGVAFGPRPVRRTLTLSTSLRSKSRAYAFSVKAEAKEVVGVSGINKIAKTKEAAGFLAKLSKDTGAKRFTFILSQESKPIMMYLKNLARAKTVFFRDANALDIVTGGTLILDRDIFGVQKAAKKVTAKPKKIKKQTK